MNWGGELEMRNRLYQESPKSCQELKNHEEFTDRQRQARIGELSMHQKRILPLCQLLTQIHDLQNKANPLADARVTIL